MLINGMVEPCSVSTDLPIIISWLDEAFEQASYSIQVTDESGTLLFQEEKQTSVRKATIKLSPSTEAHQVFFVQLSLRSREKTQKNFSSRFTTISQGIKKAEWITRLDHPIAKEATYFRDNPTIILSKTLQLDSQIKNAWIDLCGLGYYTLFINGERVGNDYLNNDVTNYDKVVYYDTYEISDFLTIGENRIAVELGNGWYNPAPINILGKYNVRKQLSIGKPCLIASVELEEIEGKRWQISTDGTWRSSEGNILMNNLFVGEKVTDQIRKKNDKTVKIPGPSGVLTPSSIPKIQRVEKCLPKSTTCLGNKVIVDFGEIISGQIDFIVSKKFIGKIIMNYSEELSNEKTLDFSSTISGAYGITDHELGITPNQRIIQSDTLEKSKQTDFHFSNQYTYHSFRYVELIFNEPIVFEEVIQDLSAFRVHTNVEVIAEFDSSSPILNDLWRVGLQTRLNNIHSYFEDCTRERFGYGGDIVALIDSHLYSIDGSSLLKKVLIDFINDQTVEGGIPATAPFVGIMTNGPSNKAGAIDWQLVLPNIANKLIEFYDETQFVRQFSSSLTKHIRYLLSFDFDYVKMCSLGDWGSIDEKRDGPVITSPDQEFCSACSYSIILQEYLAVMEQLSEDALVQQLAKKIAEVNQTILTTYYRPEEGCFGEGTQSSYIFAIKAKLLDRKKQSDLAEQLAQLIERTGGIISAGIFGMSWVYDQLHRFGYKEILYGWLTSLEPLSYHSMFAETSTLSEHFPLQDQQSTYNGSLNHAMFSSYSAWIVKQFLGISFPEGIFKKVVIRPQTELPVEKVTGSFKTPYGKIQLQWKQVEEMIIGEIVLPKNISYEMSFSSEDWQIEEHVQEREEHQELLLKMTRK
ncbi:family 78 glycoside hydrolase catalytic domain [Enterococcus sp. AZ007]|uniref:family 78 glycoside hydrolase catalytic domain n=1 Tax=Enterococcus sp. AZ007 TaxID=2774839 RepID=UPI003F271447